MNDNKAKFDHDLEKKNEKKTPPLTKSIKVDRERKTELLAKKVDQSSGFSGTLAQGERCSKSLWPNQQILINHYYRDSQGPIRPSQTFLGLK